MSASADVAFPNILWAQRSDHVFLSIPLQDASDVSVEIRDGCVLQFSATAVGQKYGCLIELFREVSSEESKHVTLPRQVELRLKKKWPDAGADDDEMALCRAWPRLTKDKTKNCHIQVDWSRWKDDDDDGENDNDGGMDFDYSNLMSQVMSQNSIEGMKSSASFEGTLDGKGASSSSGSSNKNHNVSHNNDNDNNEDDFDDLPPLE